MCVSLCQWNVIAAIDIFNKKKEYFYDQCPKSVYVNIPLLIIYLSANETLIGHTEIYMD